MGSAIGAAYAAISKAAKVQVHGITLPWSLAFQKRPKVKNKQLNHGAIPTAGIMVGPMNAAWRQAAARASQDIVAARFISETLLCPPPTFRQALRPWRPDPETTAFGLAAQLVQDLTQQPKDS